MHYTPSRLELTHNNCKNVILDIDQNKKTRYNYKPFISSENPVRVGVGLNIPYGESRGGVTPWCHPLPLFVKIRNFRPNFNHGVNILIDLESNMSPIFDLQLHVF